MKRSLGILLLIFVMIVVLRLAGFTYGYYAANILNNTNSHSISLVSKKLSVEYLDGTSIMNFDGDYLFPGDSAEKTFTIKNTGTAKITYNILIDNVLNEFVRTQDLRYVLYINNEEVTSGAINNNSIQYLYSNKEIEVGATDSVRFVFEYAITDEIQNEDMNKTISFRFNIDSYASKNEETSENKYAFNSSVSYLNNYRIYGNSMQDAQPTPDDPQEIKSVGEGITKNLLDKNLSNIAYCNAYVKSNGYSIDGKLWNTLTPYVGQSNVSWYITEPIPIKSDTVYIYSGLQSANNPGYFFLEEDKATIINGAAIKTTGTFTTPSNAKYIVMSIDSNYVETMNLQEGDTINNDIYKYKIPVKVIGKNLYGGESSLTYSSVVNYTHKSFYENFEIGKTYTLISYIDNTQGTTGAAFRMSVGKLVETTNTWDYNKSNVITAGEEGYSKTTFTIPENYNAQLNMQYIVNGGTATFKDIILVEGSYTLDNLPVYEEYFEYATNIYLDEPLRKVGNYADYIDFKEQKVVRYIKEKNLTGSENWNEYTATAGMYYTTILSDNIQSKSLGLCTHFVWNSPINDEEQCYIAGKGATYHNFFLRDFNRFPTKTDLVTFLQENEVSFISVLENPEKHPVNIPSIFTNIGNNIIKVNTEVLPSKIYIEY